MELTTELIMEWLEGIDPETDLTPIPGERSRTCPLAIFLQEKGFDEAWVGVTLYSLVADLGVSSLAIPSDLVKFIRRVDIDRERLTAARALALLNR